MTRGRPSSLVRTMLAFATLFVLFRPAPSAAGAAGSLDTTFDRDGRAATAFSTTNDIAFAVAVAPGGRILAAGGGGGQFALARYLANGSLDPSFSGDGKVTTAIGESWINGLAIQPDGKAIAVGTTATQGDVALARYLPNGSLDTAFSDDGIVVSAFSPNGDGGEDVLLQPDGKIVVAGSTWSDETPEHPVIAVARYLSDGSLDSSFGGGDGIQKTAVGSPNSSGYGVAVQPDGKIVVCGSGWIGTGNQLTVVRYLSNGSLDPDFSEDGIQTTKVGENDLAYDVEIQSDGKIVIAGTTYSGTTAGFVVARYLTNGSLDPTFNSTGVRRFAFGHRQDHAAALAIQPDGRIVVVGLRDGDHDSDIAVARLKPNGAFDLAFSDDGKQVTSFTDISARRDLNEAANAVAIQPDGRIVVAGLASRTGDDYEFAVARLLGARSPTPTTPGLVSGIHWYLNAGFDSERDHTFSFGATSDQKLVGDWDGDGDWTPGLVRGKTWFINNGLDAAADRSFTFGAASDIKLVGDWDGNGTFTPALVRGNIWYINNGLDPAADRSFTFGAASDIKLVGDWDGNGTFTPGIVRTDHWYLNNSFDSSADRAFFFSLASPTIKVVGDWD